MIKRIRKEMVVLCAIIVLLFLCLFGFSSIKAKAYNGITTLTEQQLYNETNTYNVDASCFDILRQNKTNDLRYS